MLGAVGLLITATWGPSVEMNLIFSIRCELVAQDVDLGLVFFLLDADESVSIKNVNLCGISEVDFDGIKIVSKVPLQSVLPNGRDGVFLVACPRKEKVRERELGLVRL